MYPRSPLVARAKNCAIARVRATITPANSVGLRCDHEDERAFYRRPTFPPRAISINRLSEMEIFDAHDFRMRRFRILPDIHRYSTLILNSRVECRSKIEFANSCIFHVEGGPRLLEEFRNSSFFPPSLSNYFFLSFFFFPSFF